jgi:WD repeat-containing protein 35
MPDGATLGCISWEKKAGWLCCGAADGLVKIIDMAQDASKKQAKMSTFTLVGHQKNKSKVIACSWNERYKKLTTTDESGHIIVWLEDHSSWQEEMVNNRGCSAVTDMHWSPDATRMCIAYKDGGVIVGKVDGARVWGKELDLPLSKLVWSPSCQNVVFTTSNGEAYVYDADGNQVSKLSLQCHVERGPSNIAAIAWCANILLTYSLARAHRSLVVKGAA